MEAYQGTADNLPFGDGEFDVVTLLDTVEHVPAEDEVFEECRQVLARSRRGARHAGRQVAGDGAGIHVPLEQECSDQHAPAPLHRTGVAREARTPRLSVLQWSYNNFFIFPLAAGVILLRRGRAEPELASPHFDEKSYQVEMEPVAADELASTGVGKVETSLMRRMSLPFGTSIIAIVEKR